MAITAEKKFLINDQIRAKEVRLIGGDGTQLGVLSIDEAKSLAEKEQLDLIEISPAANPPVCRLMDYGKFQFSQNKKKHQAKKNQKQTQVKEVKFRPGTGESDYQVKLRNLVRFLSNGDKAKITIRFRGREISHQELGLKVMHRIEEDLSSIADIEQAAKLEGRQLISVLAPKK